jgi:putative endonuclease
MMTNFSKTVIYTGVTNDLPRRLLEHNQEATGPRKTFAGKYQCIYLVYYERHQWIQHAIEREKEIKGWTRQKKEKLIAELNPDWRFLNEEVQD